MAKIKPSPKKVPDSEPCCPLNCCLDLLAGAWTPEILWYLQNGARRFGDLQRDLGKVSAKILTVRLKELEQRGIVDRVVIPTSPPTVEYSLTNLGEKFQPILDKIAEVGKQLRRFQV